MPPDDIKQGKREGAVKILITGANGPLGLQLSRFLLARSGVSLRLTDSMPGAASALGCEWIQADMRDPEVMPDLLDGAEHVVHLESMDFPNRDTLDAGEILYRSTCGLYNLATAAQQSGVQRFVLGSALALFDRLPAHWQVNEVWRPRPTPELADLCPWLAELSLREVLRKGAMTGICLRFGLIVNDEDTAGCPFDPRWVHMEDALHAVDRALAFHAAGMRNATQPDWFVFHIAAPGERAKIRIKHVTGMEERSISTQEPFCYAPQHDFAHAPVSEEADAHLQPTGHWTTAVSEGSAVPSRHIRNVVIFGAGGPMGAATTLEMVNTYRLRQCDLATIPDILADLAPPRSERPLPPVLEGPHEFSQVDMRNTQQVIDACEGMDAIINCSVLRHHLHDAFHVNTVGAYNVARGAIAHGIRRVVQTGPFQQMDPGFGSYSWDYDIPVDAPARPLDYLYHHTKYLGQEILRVFAEFHDLEVAVMLFWRLVSPGTLNQIPPFACSWVDSGRALRRGIEVPALPSPYEEFNVSADLPHRKHRHNKMRDVLGFVARDDLADYWQN